MNTFDKFIMWAAILLSGIAIVLTVGIAVHGSNTQPQLLGEAGTRFPHGLYIGAQSAGVPIIDAVLTGTCNLFGSTDAAPATSTTQTSCSAPGVLPGDKVFVNLASTTLGFTVAGASASSSNDFIAVSLLNLAGGASQITKVGTSTQYFIFR